MTREAIWLINNNYYLSNKFFITIFFKLSSNYLSNWFAIISDNNNPATKLFNEFYEL